MRRDLKEIQAAIDAENKEADELLRSLEIPQYTNRSLEAYRVKKKGENCIYSNRGWISGASKEVLSLLNEGDPYILETRNNTISGYIINGRWYDRKSDQDIKREHDEWLKRTQDRHDRFVEEHREEWLKREEKLPDWLKAEMEEARKEPDFEKGFMGWGYILMICELAAMYIRIGLENLEGSDEVKRFYEENGVSGNQHDMAVALVKRHLKSSE